MILANKILKKEIKELNLITKKIFLSKNEKFLKLCENSLCLSESSDFRVGLVLWIVIVGTGKE